MRISDYARSLAVAMLGAAAFWWFALPLPFLFGPMFATMTAAVLGVRLGEFSAITQGARCVLGVAIGASLTPALIAMLPKMAMSLAIVPAYVVVIGLIGLPFFIRICRFDPMTAFFAAMPGGASDMTALAAEAGANLRQVALVHVTRLIVIMVLAPLVLVSFFEADLSGKIGATMADQSPLQFGLQIIAAAAGFWAAKKVGLFGASILGPLIVAGGLSLIGLLTERPPREALWATQFFIGLSIGRAYVGLTLQELRRTVLGAVAFVLILTVITASVTELIVLADLSPPREAFLAFMPGGQAEMTLLTLTVGADVGFVISHHILRIISVMVLTPLIWRHYRRRKR